MKKLLTIKILSSIILFNCGFAYANRSETGRDIQDKYCWYLDDFAKKDGETSHHIHQQAPKIRGFQNEEPPITSKSHTFGDTTYHTYEQPSPRKGFQ